MYQTVYRQKSDHDYLKAKRQHAETMRSSPGMELVRLLHVSNNKFFVIMLISLQIF